MSRFYGLGAPWMASEDRSWLYGSLSGCVSVIVRRAHELPAPNGHLNPGEGPQQAANDLEPGPGQRQSPCRHAETGRAATSGVGDGPVGRVVVQGHLEAPEEPVSPPEVKLVDAPRGLEEDRQVLLDGPLHVPSGHAA